MLTACVETGTAGTEWVLQTVDNVQVDYSAILSLADPGRVTGQAPCNRYFADLKRDGDTFQLGLIGATRMACLQIKGEAAFFQLLQSVDHGVESLDNLTLSGGGHVLVFGPAAR